MSPASDGAGTIVRSQVSAHYLGDLGASSVSLHLLRRRRLTLVWAAHQDPERDEQFEAMASLARGVALSTADLRATAARSGRTARDRHVASPTARISRSDVMLVDDLEHRLALPVLVDDRKVVGVLTVAGDEEVIDRVERDFVAVDGRFDWADRLESMSPVFGPVWRVEAMAELSSALGAVVNRDELAAEVLDAGLDAVGAVAGSFMLMTRPGVYELVQSRNIDRRLVDRWGVFGEVPGRDPFSDAIVQGRAQFFPSVASMVDSYPHLWQDIAETGHMSWAVVPFVARGDGPVGALGAVFDTPQAFERAQRISCRTVAHLAASAALRVETQRAERQVIDSLTDRLLGMTETATDAGHLSSSGYYQPAGDYSVAGGDWFDVIGDPTNPDRTYAVLGDVADHGPDAAGAMVAIRAWIQAAVQEGLEPAGIAEKTSRLIVAYRYPITTAVIACVDAAAGVLTWCCAGHPHVLFADDGSVAFHPTAHGPPLGVGMATAASYDQAIRTIGGPLSVVLYSDGLLQRYHGDVDAGFDALRSVAKRLHCEGRFSASDLARRMASPARHSTDDVAVLVIHLDPKVFEDHRRDRGHPGDLGEAPREEPT